MNLKNKVLYKIIIYLLISIFCSILSNIIIYYLVDYQNYIQYIEILFEVISFVSVLFIAHFISEIISLIKTNDKNSRGKYTIVIALLLIAINLGFRFGIYQYKCDKLVESGQKTIGIISEINKVNIRRTHKRYIHYTYLVNNKTIEHLYNSKDKSYNIGDTIYILYDKERPEFCKVFDSKNYMHEIF